MKKVGSVARSAAVLAALGLVACQGNKTSQPPAAAASKPAAAPVKPMGTLSIKGFVTGDGHVWVDPVFCVDAASETPPPGPHALHILGADDKRLASYTFGAEPRGKDKPEPSDPRYFELRVPAIDFGELVVEAEGAPPLRKRASANGPSIKLDPITEASFLPSGKLRLSWTAGDADGAQLFVRVETSADDGKTWRELPGMLEEQRVVEVDARWLKASDTTRVRATVSDGLRCARDEIGPFVVPKRPPVVRIRRTFKAKVAAGASVELHADVGSENGPVDGKTILWTSSVDGELGRGPKITISSDDRSAGTHVITASFTDAAGLSKTDQVSVEIERKAP